MNEWFKDWFDKDYAAIYAHRDASEAEAAVAMALALAPQLGAGPVLDLGCGGGRHLAVLRRSNPLAFGLDLSRDLLGLAPGELRPWLLRGDMRRLPVKPASLAGICMWFTPFGYFSDPENRELCRHLRGLLRPGGVLVLDYLNAPFVRAHLVPADLTRHGDIEVSSRRTLEGDRLVKRMTLTHLESGSTREAMESLRLYEPAELRAMALDCGLQLRREAGDYQGAPFTEAGSARWIGFLSRPQSDKMDPNP
ncbi:MAG: class I SAM-dependent methyltransferase [Holophaga sp.]|nr:class I SAM-dependent methyltransferase [Holophaga sp.]